MLNDYTVIAAGHEHAGKPLAIGDTVSLRAAQAERYPNTFKLKQRTTSTKAERPARASHSATQSKPADTAGSSNTHANED
jgi:hypothetical protein